MIEDFFDQVNNGSGRALVFESDAGMGKSALLRFLREQAPRHGIQVLHARGAELERGFVWGVARQLFERWMSSASAAEKEAVLSGPARLATPLLEFDQATAPEMPDLHPMVHGLYWMCRNLSKRQPLVIVVDDAHWADTESLNMLAYLANRLEDGPIGLVLATIPLEKVNQGELLAAATISAFARLARLEPLGLDAMKAVLTDELGSAPEEEFLQACHRASSGSPLLLQELLRDTTDANLWTMTSRRMAVDVLRRLNRLGAHTTRVACAVAALESHADPRHCARVAELSNAESTTAARELVDAGILRVGTPYAFAHPMMQSVVYSSMTPQERHHAHHLAAQTLHSAGEPTASVAQHLLRTLPGADGWVVNLLRDAAAECVRNGNPEQAVRFLRRALAEPPDDAVSSQVLSELGGAELRAGDGASVRHLTEAVRRVRADCERHRARLDLGHALVAAGRHQDAVDVLSEGMDEVAGGAARQLRSTIGVIVDVTEADTSLGLRRETHGERARAALRGLCGGWPADRVARLATGALVGRSLLGSLDLALPPAGLAAWALAQSGRLLESGKVLSELDDAARHAGHLLTADTAAGMQALVLYETGQLGEAENRALAVLGDRDNDALAGPGVWLAAAAYLKTLIELDRIPDAQAVFAKLSTGGSVPEAAYCLPARIAHGRLLIAEGDLDEGVQRLTASRRLSIDLGWHHPGVAADYVGPLSSALVQLDKSEAGFAVLRDELAQARAFGAVRPLATALRSYGLLTGGKAGLQALEEAGVLLEGSPYLLDRAYAMVELGSALRRSGRRTDGRRRLLSGLEIAQQCGAVALGKAARTELRLAGGRARIAQPAVAAPLTPAEQRVVVKAAEGMTNKQISRALFVTVKTVEWHLGQAYRKLGINKRAELVHALPDVELVEESEIAVS